MTDDAARAPNIYPFLRYQDAPAAITFLKRAFGFEEVAVYEGPVGTIAHAELRLGPGIVMLGSARHDNKPTVSRDIDQIDHGVYIAVEDVEAHHARAKSESAEIVRDLEDTDYGSREYSALDPEGYWWSFGTYHPAAGDQ